MTDKSLYPPWVWKAWFRYAAKQKVLGRPWGEFLRSIGWDAARGEQK